MPTAPRTAPMCVTVTHEEIPAEYYLCMPADATGMGSDWEALVCYPCASRIIDRYARLDPPVTVVVEPLESR